jgi:rRNA maturation endonuclease Nob1
MGLFEKAGRKFESFVQTAEEAADETADFACEACDARFHTARDECPECGGAVVERASED